MASGYINITMFRFRRYRVFLICAVLMVILIVRFRSSEEWDALSPVNIEGNHFATEKSSSNKAGGDVPAAPGVAKSTVDIEHLAHANDPPPPPTVPKPIVADVVEKPKEDATANPKENPPVNTNQDSSKPDETVVEMLKEHPAEKPEEDTATKPKDITVTKPKEDAAIPSSVPVTEPGEGAAKPKDPPEAGNLKPVDKMNPTKTVPQVVIPDRKPLVLGESPATDDAIHPVAPGRKEPVFTEQPVHWKKQPERFPVPAESIIHLPTEKPLPIPKIQFKFLDETPMAKADREIRLLEVKMEFQKAWNGYKKFAWMHDELMPESGGFKDPFCGWAATLVDSLDTLWIMGLEDDFSEAVEGVKNIDFTTCTRSDLPVFEVTIRYLGGLIAAYDISGQIHQILLDKAVELGEILIGAFDTPNRMPMLFYQWKPAFASQAHRASSRSNLAELGSLSVEFTRLSQLTKQPKYYDAVARITDAFEDWQKRGTRLSGVFPDTVDASGCNHTLPDAPKLVADANIGYQHQGPTAVREPKPKKGKGNSNKDTLELQIIPGSPEKGSIRKVPKVEVAAKEAGKVSKRDVGETGAAAEGHTPPPESTPVSPIAPAKPVVPVSPPAPPSQVNPDVPGLPVLESEAKSIEPAKTVTQLSTPTDEEENTSSSPGSWDCVSQGLDSANSFIDHFSMGGSQDSTYEYFSKEYMLLGGHEEKYRTLYVNTMDAVRNHMLYRPMVPGNADILFSGRVVASSNNDNSEVDIMLDPEVTHLTCFLGGMVGMGAKLFEIEADMEIAKKLTDGCIWAYASMGSGVMPENAQLFPCPSATECFWNETLWLEHLDPMKDTREQMIKNYDETKARNNAQKERDRIAAEAKIAAEAEEFNSSEFPQVSQIENTKEITPGQGATPASFEAENLPIASEKLDEQSTSNVIGSIDTHNDQLSNASKVQKRQAEKQAPKPMALAGNNANPQTTEIDGGNPAGNQTSLATPELSKSPAQLEQDTLEEKKKKTEEELSLAASGREERKSPGPQLPPTSVVAEDDVDPYRPLSHAAYVQSRIERENLKPGYLRIYSDRYILRPEAIESVWYMYRITGDPIWQEKGWKMFNAIITNTKAKHGHSAFNGVASGPAVVVDQMESFWLAETLKYFYLLYSTPDTLSLDEWVLNTEAHPFKRPT